MQTVLRRFLIFSALGVIATAIMAAAATARTSSHAGWGSFTPAGTAQRLDVLAKKIAFIQRIGGTSKLGTLATLATCGYTMPTQVFGQFGDPAYYSLAPEGNLSFTGGWTLTNVGFSADHDPYTSEAGSLTFSANNSDAVTPVMCVDMTNPTMRFFTAHQGGNGHSQLQVSVVYEGVNGQTQTLPLATISGGSSWAPSPVVPIGVNALSTVSANGWTPVAFDFSVSGLQPGESYSVDGVYIDPCWSR